MLLDSSNITSSVYAQGYQLGLRRYSEHGSDGTRGELVSGTTCGKVIYQSLMFQSPSQNATNNDSPLACTSRWNKYNNHLYQAAGLWVTVEIAMTTPIH